MVTLKYSVLACIAVVATSLSVVERAQSATVITGGSPGALYASAVDDLVVGSVTYDVTFSTAANATFESDSTDAATAAGALATALTGASVTDVQDAITTSLYGVFVVQWFSASNGEVVFNNGGTWEDVGGPGTGTGGEVAQFSATPLPGALPLFATVLGGMGVLGWRKKRKNVAAVAGA